MTGTDMLLPRRDLRDRVLAALERGAVLVVAPPGYGKSTLIESVLRELPMPSARLTCTDADRDPRHLLLRVVSAIADAVPGASDDLRDRLLASTAPLDPLLVLDDLLDQLDRVLVEPVVVALDEADRLAGAPQSLAMTAELLAGGRRALRAAVTSRVAMRMRARRATGGVVHRLGVSDLAFDEDECAALIEAVTGRVPDRDEVAAVLAATEGWPLAVAALCGTLRLDAAATVTEVLESGGLHTTAQVRDLLDDEVLERLDPAERDQVLASAVPRFLTPGLVTTLDLGKVVLDGPAGSRLFLRPIADQPDAWAYHPLIRQCLLERLTLERPDHEMAALRRQAGQAMVAAGFVIDGVEHLLDADDVPGVLAAVEAHGEELIVTAPQVVRDWLARLPPELLADPSLRVLAGRLAMGTGDFESAIALLGAALDDWPSGADGEWLVRHALMTALFLRGDLEEAFVRADGFADTAVEDRAAAAAAGMYAAHCLAALGDAARSDAMAAEAREMAPDVPLGPLDAVRQTYLDLPAGRLDPALGTVASMLAEVELADPLLLRPGLLSAKAHLLAQDGRHDQARACWERIEAEGRESLFSFAVEPARAAQALLQAQMGRVSAAEALLAGVEGAGWGWFGCMPSLTRAVVSAARGDRAQTVLAGGLAVQIAAAAPPAIRVLVACDLVAALVRVGATDEAGTVLEDARRVLDDAFPGASGRMLRARLGTLDAGVCAVQGDTAGSDEALRRSIEEAGGSLQHVLRREWSSLQPLVWSALERAVLDPDATMRAVVAAFPGGLELVPFVEHPVAAVRRAALAPAMTSGHPDGAEGILRRREDPDPAVAAAATTLVTSGLVAHPPRVFTLLGGFEVRRGEWVVDEQAWGRPIAARLVRYLLLGSGGVPADHLCEALWPKLSPDGARRSLQVAASRARAALDHPGVPRSTVEVRDGVYRLCLDDSDVVDADEFRQAATAALRDPTITSLQHAASLWTGEPLPEERYADWAASWRQRLIEQYGRVLTALADLHHADGDHHAALRPALELVDLDPFDEEAHQALMVTYARAGRRGAALHHYLECRRTLVAELGVEPSLETARLQARIAAGEDV